MRKKLPLLAKRILSFVVIFVLFGILYKLLIPRINAFGCFDDCFNFLGGYFILHGKKLYEEIFFNHQPLFAFISFLVQKFSDPINIYDLILKHRQLLMGFALLMNLLLVWRFRWTAVFFAVSFELTKYYFFGDRFLAESFIVYPLVYLLGITLSTIKKEKITNFDAFLSAIFCWFIVFSREPYVPVSLFLYTSVLLHFKSRRVKIISLVIFSLLCAITLTQIFSGEYVYQLITLNSTNSLSSDIKGKQLLGPGLFLIFFYPLFIIYEHASDIVWQFLTKVSLIFCFALIFLWKKRGIRLWHVLFILSVLFLANLRYAEPHFVFYGTFHIVPWHGLFLLATFFLLERIKTINKTVGVVSFAVIIISLFLVISDKKYFAYETSDPHQVYLTQFGPIQQAGSAFRELSSPGDKLFVDGFDDLVYWEAKMFSDYPYSWYTSVMPSSDKYLKARYEMFKKNPPQFYYGLCPGESNENQRMPDEFKNDYVGLTSQNKPTCIHIHAKKLPQITDKQWKKAQEWLYDRPKETVLAPADQ